MDSLASKVSKETCNSNIQEHSENFSYRKLDFTRSSVETIFIYDGPQWQEGCKDTNTILHGLILHYYNNVILQYYIIVVSMCLSLA